MRDEKFIRAGLTLSFLGIAAGAMGYLYQIVIGRMFAPSEYSLFSSLMALIGFLMAPISGISLIITRKVSFYRAHNLTGALRKYFLATSKYFAISSVIFILIFLFVSEKIKFYLHSDSTYSILISGLLIIVAIYVAINNAFLQGMQLFLWLGSLGLLTVALKIISSVVFIFLGYGVGGALIGIMLAFIFIVVLTQCILRKQWKNRIEGEKFTKEVRQLEIDKNTGAISIIAASIATAVMTQLDMILVNWYFDSKQAGLYAAASVIGKAVLFLPGGLVLSLFPIVSERYAKNENSIRILIKAIVFTFSGCGVLAITYYIFGDSIILFFYGEKYKGAGEILSIFGFAMLPLTIVIVVEQYLLAHGKVIFAWIFFIIAPFQIWALYQWHTSLVEVVYIIGISATLLAIIGLCITWIAINPKRK